MFWSFFHLMTLLALTRLHGCTRRPRVVKMMAVCTLPQLL
jgi:hypothetical protein